MIISGLLLPLGLAGSPALSETVRGVGGQVRRSVFQAETYNPAILSLSFTIKESEGYGNTAALSDSDKADSFLDLVLVTRDGQPVGRRVLLNKLELQKQLQAFYRQLARQEPLQTSDPDAPARRLYDALIGPIAPMLTEQGVTTLVIAAERGLQAVPFAALHSGTSYFGETYAFSVTPSLQLTSLGPPTAAQGRMLAAGASRFPELAPLPLVEQELQRMNNDAGVDRFLNNEFTPDVLLDMALQNEYGYVHIATHAEFLPGGPQNARIYAGTGAIPMSRFSDVRQGRQEKPINLFSLSACRTAVGDGDSELGFAGLALQAGAKSAAGSLWYVDDIATSAFFVQFYRYLGQGLPKAEAMQQVRVDILDGRIRQDGDRILGADDAPLLTDLTREQQRRVSTGLSHPFFWGGIELLGVPW